MKKTTILMAILGSLAVSGAANAANSQATMKLEGTIIPATCNINLDGGNSKALSLGKISAADVLKEGGNAYQLQEKTVHLNINCPSPTIVGFQVMDLGDKAGQVDLAGAKNSALFSLGTTKSGAISGGYLVSLSSGKIDAQTVAQFISSETGENWNIFNSENNGIDASKKTIYSWTAKSGNLAPAIGLSHSIEMEIHPYVNPLSEKDAADQINLRGEATYDLVYL